MRYTIQNKTRRMKTVLLEHPLAKRDGRFVYRSAHNARSGAVTTQREFSSTPRALTIPALSRVKHQPAWIVQVPRVQQLVHLGELALTQEKEASGGASKEPPPETSSASGQAETGIEGSAPAEEPTPKPTRKSRSKKSKE